MISGQPEIHALTPYGLDGSSARVRVFDWIGYLGLSAAISDYAGLANNAPRTLLRHPVRAALAEHRVRRLVPCAPRLIVSREATPFGNGALEQRLLAKAEYGVFDFDDALYVQRGVVKRLFGGDGKTARMVASADTVIAGNETLASWAESHSRDVHLIPSCVDPDRYVTKNTWDLNDPPRLLWIGSRTTEQYLGEIQRPLLEMHQLTGARLTVISSPVENRSLRALASMIDRVPWSPAAVRTHAVNSDIAIAPLSNTPFARGKCAYKLLEYAASGLPIVGSPVGANSRALERFDGIKAWSQSDWTGALTEILGEPVSRRALRGARARQAVRDFYSFSAWAKGWTAAVKLDLPPSRLESRSHGLEPR